MSGHLPPASSEQSGQHRLSSPELIGRLYDDCIVFLTPPSVPGHEGSLNSHRSATETVNTGREGEVTQDAVKEWSLIPTGSARSAAFNRFMQSYRSPTGETTSGIHGRTPGETSSAHSPMQPQQPRFSQVTLRVDQNDGWTVTGNVQVDDSEGVVRSLSVSLEFWCDPNNKTGKPWRLSILREEFPGAGTKESTLWKNEEYMTRSGIDELMAKVYSARYGKDFTDQGGYFSTAQGQVGEQALYKHLRNKIPVELCSKKPRFKSSGPAP